MEKERNIKELLIILRDRIEEPDNIIETECSGLCWACFVLKYERKINPVEYEILLDYIERNRPNNHESFSWGKGLKPPRLRWVNKQIKLRSWKEL